MPNSLIFFNTITLITGSNKAIDAFTVLLFIVIFRNIFYFSPRLSEMTTAKDLFHNLIDDGLLDAKGFIKASLMDIDCVIKSKSVVGDIIQNWFEIYLTKKGINFGKPTHSQKFPDIILPSDNDSNFLELKAFDGDKTPNFDIANLEAYCQSLIETPKRLDSNYLIFAYRLNENSGELSIKKLWLKKVWQITTKSKDYAVKVQQKKGMIYNIRPCTWYSERAEFLPFSSREEFVNALEKLVNSYPGLNHLKTAKWKQKVEAQYLSQTGQSLSD